MAAIYALAAAGLFGASTPASKLLLGSIDPFVVAGLLYCGAGIGVSAVRRLAPLAVKWNPPQVSLKREDFPWLAAGITAGGIVGPLLLMWGLSRTDASAASLLLALEGATTALIAWLVFRESFNRRILAGMGCLVAGATILSWAGIPSGQNVLGPLAIFGACVAWGLDNNLTRKVAQADPLQIVEFKGLIAGPVNIGIGIWSGATVTPHLNWILAGVIGFFGYGISIALYVTALRHLGAARTGAYFSTAPFFGAAISIIALGDVITVSLIIAGGLMGLGVWLHITEKHLHRHTHMPVAHEHPHLHDEHHQHEHQPNDPAGEPHSHWHAHVTLSHTHPHAPDTHHTHQH